MEGSSNFKFYKKIHVKKSQIFKQNLCNNDSSILTDQLAVQLTHAITA